MLIGENVILQEICPSHIEQMRVWRNDPNLRQHFREWKDITKDQQEKWYKERGNNTNQFHVYFSIMRINKREKSPSDAINSRYLIGCCNLSYIDWRIRSAEFGIFLAKDRGAGCGKEALEIMCDYGFKEANLHKIWCEVWDGNRSVELYRKIGFKDEGVLRHSYFHNGKYGSSYILSVLEDEWREKYGIAPIYK
jgi:RimJ/RimL family protein N-acetyltransferase